MPQDCNPSVSPERAHADARIAMIDRERDVLERLATRLMTMLERLDEEQSRLLPGAPRPTVLAEPGTPSGHDDDPTPMPTRIGTPALQPIPRPALVETKPKRAMQLTKVIARPPEAARVPAPAPARARAPAPAPAPAPVVAAPRPVAIAETRPLYHSLIASKRSGGRSGPVLPPPPSVNRTPLPSAIPTPVGRRDTEPLAYR